MRHKEWRSHCFINIPLIFHNRKLFFFLNMPNFQSYFNLQVFDYSKQIWWYKNLSNDVFQWSGGRSFSLHSFQVLLKGTTLVKRVAFQSPFKVPTICYFALDEFTQKRFQWDQSKTFSLSCSKSYSFTNREEFQLK